MAVVGSGVNSPENDLFLSLLSFFIQVLVVYGGFSGSEYMVVSSA